MIFHQAPECEATFIGQTLETDHVDSLKGLWFQGHLRELTFEPYIVYPSGFGTPMLDDLDPTAVGKTTSVTLNVTDRISFTIPVTDPKWPTYRNALPEFRYDGMSWNNMAAQGSSHVQMEKRLYVEINAYLSQRQKSDRALNQGIISKLAQAGYVAQQPTATQDQKDFYAKLRAQWDPILAKSTRPLIATQMLLKAIQDDIIDLCITD